MLPGSRFAHGRLMIRHRGHRPRPGRRRRSPRRCAGDRRPTGDRRTTTTATRRPRRRRRPDDRRRGRRSRTPWTSRAPEARRRPEVRRRRRRRTAPPRPSRTPTEPEPDDRSDRARGRRTRPRAAEPRRAADRRAARRRRAARGRACATRSPCPARASSACSRRLGDAGIRVVATRHEGGAAFMAEAHGQLTGRPAACIGTRAVGAANLAIGIHTARQDSTPDVRPRRPGRAGAPRATRPSRRSTRSPRSAASRSGRPSRRRGRRRRAGARRGDPPGPRRPARAGPAVARPRTCSTSTRPATPASTPARPGPRAPVRRRHPGGHRAARVGRAAGHPRRRRRPAGADVDRPRSASPSCSGSRSSPLAPRRRHLQRPPAVPRDGRARRRRRPSASGSSAPTRCSSSAAGSTRPTSWRGHDPGRRRRAGPTSTSSRGAVARACRPPSSRSPPTRGRSCGPPTSGWSARRCSTPSWSDARQADERDATARPGRRATVDATPTPWAGPGVHPGRVDRRRCAGVLPDDAIVTTDAGNFAGWAGRGFRFRRPGTFLGPTSGAMGYGAPGGDRGGARPSRPGRRGARRRRRPGDDDGRARDGRSRAAPGSSSLVFDNERYGTIRMWQERRGTRAGRSRPSSARSTSPPSAAASAPAASASSATRTFEPALRQALVEDRPTVIQLALDRALGVGRPARHVVGRLVRWLTAQRSAGTLSSAPKESCSHARRHRRRPVRPPADPGTGSRDRA